MVVGGVGEEVGLVVGSMVVGSVGEEVGLVVVGSMVVGGSVGLSSI